MKKLLAICTLAMLILAFGRPTTAGWYVFEFSEEDLWNHTTSSDTRLYNQDSPLRHHISWKSNVQTTDSTQPNQNEYQTTSSMGTNGWYQTDTFESWLSGGPLDNYSNAFGICEVQLWGAGWPNSRFAWNERYRVNAGAAAWIILATPEGWAGDVVDNPWPDNGSSPPLDQYYIDWYADEYAERILYTSAGDGIDDYIFRFAVDIVGEYPTFLESSPDGDPFETDGSLRVWFGGVVLDPSEEWTWEGLDGVMELTPMNLGECISAQIKDQCSDLTGRDRATCNHEQTALCQELFDVPSRHARPEIGP